MLTIQQLTYKLQNLYRLLRRTTEIEMVEVTGAAYTLLPAHNDRKILRFTEDGPIAVTIPASGIDVNKTYVLYPEGASGVITVTGAPGTTVRGDNVSAGRYKALQLIHEEPDVWLILGGITV